MATLLLNKRFPIPKIPQPGGFNSDISNTSSLDARPFDHAFLNFMDSTDQPDKYATQAWLMLAPQPEYVMFLDLHAQTRPLTIEQWASMDIFTD